MAITKGAKKAHRASLRKRVFNDRRKIKMRSIVKDIKKLVVGKKGKDAEALIPNAYKAIDKAVKTGLIKKNAGSRKKSRLVAMINKIK